MLVKIDDPLNNDTRPMTVEKRDGLRAAPISLSLVQVNDAQVEGKVGLSSDT